MSPSLSARVAMVCLLAIAVAGCDRQSAGNAQANVAEAASPSPDEAPPAAGSGAPAAAKTGADRSHAGSNAPAVSFRGPDGKPTTLAAFRGKPVLVNLWATWCAPCVAELPTLGALQARGTVPVVAISQDTRDTDKVPAFLKAHGAASLAPYVDDTMALGLAYQATLPTTILFDAQGKEVWRWNGGNDWASPAAAALIAEAR